MFHEKAHYLPVVATGNTYERCLSEKADNVFELSRVRHKLMWSYIERMIGSKPCGLPLALCCRAYTRHTLTAASGTNHLKF